MTMDPTQLPGWRRFITAIDPHVRNADLRRLLLPPKEHRIGKSPIQSSLAGRFCPR